MECRFVIKAGYLLQVGATAPFLPTALDVRVVKKPGLDTRAWRRLRK